jgi:heterokaryon incompatibility protein (HET)
MAPFKYKPLETPTTIRLAVIPPTSGRPEHEMLDVKLEHHEISEASKKYNALSYVWGSPDRIHMIKIDGQDFWVTKNLMYFLRRPREEQSYWWIDAISINQDDVEDKSVQIPLMRQIYESADFVHVELGPAESPAEEYALNEMKHMSDATKEAFFENNPRGDNKGIYILFHSVRLPHIHPRYDHEYWKGVSSLLNKPWWSRVWVMQEGTASTNTSFHCGEASASILHLHDMNLVLHTLYHQQPWMNADPPTEAPEIQHFLLWRLINIAVQRRDGTRQHLLDVLEYFRGLDARKSQDKVYAALGLADDIPPGTIIGDYNESLPELYRKVTTYYIEHLENPLDVLYHCGTHLQNVSIPTDYSSWVPQWERRITIVNFPKSSSPELGAKARLYNADGLGRQSAANILDRAQKPRVVGNTLVGQGLLVGRLASCLTPILGTESTPDETFRKSVDDWTPTDGDTVYEITGETKLRAFLRTLVADLAFDVDYREFERGGQAKWDTVGNQPHAVDNVAELYRTYFFSRNRRLAYTEDGYMCLVSHQADVNDAIFMLFGGSVLYVLRPQGDDYVFIGECYVHGLMDGEALKFLEDGRAQVQEVRIV